MKGIGREREKRVTCWMAKDEKWEEISGKVSQESVWIF